MTHLTRILCSKKVAVNTDKMTAAPSGHIGPLLFPMSRSLWVSGPRMGPPPRDFGNSTLVSQRQVTGIGHI
jgi:hypothetical protein